MALKTFTNSTTIQSGFVLKLTITEDSIDTSTNKSSCTATLQLIIDSGASVSGSYVDYSLSGDTSASGGGGSAYFNAGTHTLLTKTYTKSHSDDGTGSTSVTGTLNIPAVGWNNRTVTTSGTLTNIPRGFTTKPKVSLASATDKSITIKWETSENCDRVDYNISGTSVQNAWTGNAKTGNITISNLQEGKAYSVYIWCRKKDSQVGQISDTKSMSTYVKPTNTLNSKTETTIKVNWSAGDYIDRIRYSSDNGSTWSEWSTINAKSGNYTISGLLAKKDYNIKTELRWKSNNNITSTTDKLAVTTHQYPYVKSIGTNDLNVGASTLTQTFKLYNPLNRNATIYMKLANNTVITCGSTTNGTDVVYTYTFTTSGSNNDKDKMNSSITDTTLTKNATYYCTYSSQTVSTVSGKYHINRDDVNYKPTFNYNYWSFTTNYGANNRVAIAGKSTVTVTINTAATPSTGTSISEYRVKWGNDVTEQVITNISNPVNLVNGTSDTIMVTAKDGRGFTRETTQNIEVIPYTDVKLSTKKAIRANGIGEDVYLTLSGSFYTNYLYNNGSKVTNTIRAIKYYVKKKSETTYKGPYNVTYTISGSNYKTNNFRIYSNGSSENFDLGTKYDVRITVQDWYNTYPFDIEVTDGKIAVDCYQDSNGDYHRGINGLGSDDCNQLINGTERVTQALMIPKNGSAGYGICNSDGMSILRDHNNQNVVLNSTGKTLFLGYQNTTGLNILSSKVMMNSDGEITTDLTLKRGNVNTTLYIGDTDYQKINEVRTRNSSLDVGIGPDAQGTFRIWNYTHSKEIIRTTAAGVNSFNGNASTASQVYTNSNYPASQKTLYPVMCDNTAIGNKSLYFNDKTQFIVLEGTTSSAGYNSLYLGNNKATGTAGNSYGAIRLYGRNTGKADVIYANSTSNATLTLPAHTGNIQSSTQLYNNTNGSTGTITLSETSANFDYIDIYFQFGATEGPYTGPVYGFSRIYSPNGKVATLNGTWVYNNSNGATQTVTKQILINTTKITNKTYSTFNVQNGTTGLSSYSNAIYITRVEGWK